MDLIIITGLSGAGKSQAVNCLEDLGYYCVDNMPPSLMNEFLKLASGSADISKVAFVADIRGGIFFDDLRQSLERLREEGQEFKIMFLEASDKALIRRYNESRRQHPLYTGGSLEDDIKREREMLSEIRKMASIIIDTSNIKTADLNAEIAGRLSGDRQESFIITVESFGFKYGVLAEADWILDARFLPNPFYVDSLKKLTGNNKKVREYVMRSYEPKDFVARITGLIRDIIPSYVREGKYHMVIGVGCTGGQHRSVVIANEIAETFRNMGKHVVLLHRDLR